MRRRALLSTAATGLAALTGCVASFDASVEESREYEFDLPDGARFRTGIDNGDVDVSTHGGSGVLVGATVSAPSEDRLDDVTIEGVEDGGDFVLDVEVDGSSDRVSVDVDVRVPDGTEVAAARTRNGDVTVRGVAAAEGVGSTNGDVTVRDAGPVSTVATANGDVAVDVPAPLRWAVDASTENGDVDVALSPDADAALTATTENGDASVSELDLSERESSRTRVSGVLGDGAREVVVESVNGDVTVTALA